MINSHANSLSYVIFHAESNGAPSSTMVLTVEKVRVRYFIVSTNSTMFLWTITYHIIMWKAYLRWFFTAFNNIRPTVENLRVRYSPVSMNFTISYKLFISRHVNSQSYMIFHENFDVKVLIISDSHFRGYWFDNTLDNDNLSEYKFYLDT